MGLIKYNPFHTSKLIRLPDAVEVEYDNSDSGLIATNVKEALDELSLSVGLTFFEFNQIISSDTWIINHNLARFPSITVIDNSNQMIEPGTVTYIDANNVQLEFQVAGNPFPISGKAYLI